MTPSAYINYYAQNKFDSQCLPSMMPISFEKNRPNGEAAQWRCIQDVHMLARCLRITPLEIDRLFFMIGSGRFNNVNRVNLPQEERYKLLMPFLADEDLWRCK
jgi:hypothetical protein